MDCLQSLISRIRQQCDVRAVDLETELISYDRKQQGIISPVSLHRWISSLGLNFSTQQVQTLVQAFKKGEGVDWRALQMNIENSKQYQSASGVDTGRAPTQCTAELIKLGQNLNVRRQTLREVLKPFDTLNRGRVTADQLYKAFGCNEVTKAIVKYYADTVTGFIDYLRLQNDIKNVATVQENNDGPVSEVPDCFETLVRYIKNRSIDLYALFKRADSGQTGKLQENHFISAIASIQSPLSPVDVRDITQVFLDNETGQCNYKQFIASVEVFRPRPSARVASATLKAEQMPPRINVPGLIEEIKAIVRQRRMNVREYFAALPQDGYDNDAPVRIFGQVLNAMKLSLSPDEIKAIALAYQVRGQPGSVDYKAFMDTIIPKVTSSQISSTDVVTKIRNHLANSHMTFRASAERYDRERSGQISSNQLYSALQFVGYDVTNQEVEVLCQHFPGKILGFVAWMDLADAVDSKNADSMRSSRKIFEDTVTRKAPEMVGKPPKSVNNILLVVQKYVKTQNLDLEREFLRYDRYQKGYVNIQDFYDTIYGLRLPLNQNDVRALSMYYRISGSPDVNYGDFIDGVNAAEPIEEEVEGYLPPEETPLPTLSASVHNFLRRFKSFAIMRRINAVDVFEPYDNQRNGTIQVFKVAAAFNNIQFPAMRAELEDLTSAFRDQNRRELFNYHLFDRAVKEEDIDNDSARAQLTGAPISAEVNRDALTTCLQIHEKLQQRRRRVDALFVGVTTDTIPSKEFQRRLEDTGFVLRAGQLTALCRKYRVGLTDAIKWREFCADVEKSRTIGDGF